MRDVIRDYDVLIEMALQRIVDIDDPTVIQNMIRNELYDLPIEDVMSYAEVDPYHTVIDPLVFLEEWTKSKLIELLNAYDYYVSTYPENHDEDCYPVCLSEFLSNEWRERWL